MYVPTQILATTSYIVDEILAKLNYSSIWAKYKESNNYGVALTLFDREDQGPDSG